MDSFNLPLHSIINFNSTYILKRPSYAQNPMSADILNYTLNALGFKSSDPVSDKARELFRTVQQNGNNKSFFHVVVIEAACKILRVTNYNKSKLRSHANMTTDKYLKCLYLLKNIHKWQWESHVSIEALDTRFGDNKLASITYSILGMFISKLPASQQVRCYLMWLSL